MRVPSRWVLIAVGVLVFALGAGAWLLAGELTNPHAGLAADTAVVPTEACLSCHNDAFRAAERALQPMAIHNPVARTVAVAAVDARAEALPVVPLAGETRPYAVSDAPLEDEQMAHAPRLLLRTDEGVTVLPDGWNTLPRMGRTAAEWCEACHAPTPTATVASEL